MALRALRVFRRGEHQPRAKRGVTSGQSRWEPKTGAPFSPTPKGEKVAAVGPQSKTLTEEKLVKNVDITVNGQLLVVTIDLTEEFGGSNSGKSIIVASTEGPTRIPGRPERLNLSVYRPR
jgi:hypothetical protein